MNRSVAATEDASTLTGRRVAARARVTLTGFLETVQGTQKAILKNVSATGAMLEIAELPTVGADGIFKCAALDCFGTIAWAHGRWCGVAFDEPITHAEVLQVRKVSDQAAFAPDREAREAALNWAQGRGNAGSNSGL